ncbi:MAG TPA: PQQ-binding-like beta-propeller repeat protein [Polyangiaceae bacterium]|jgi:outer membrane protein assembly factor BamB|nr:PQQ-binding-like beta-propeller repeat protein [Polyangiaceae bacterium]
MSAIQVVVRPRPETAPSTALQPLYGLFDVIVDGVNITARLGEGQALALLSDLGLAVSSLARGKRDRETLQLYTDDEAWEIGLEADGGDVLVSVFRSGPSPQVAVHERRVELFELRRAILAALEEAPLRQAPPAIVASLGSVRRLLDTPYPSFGRRPLTREDVRIAPRALGGLSFAASLSVRAVPRSRCSESAELERADLHSLLGRGAFGLTCRNRTVALGEACLFLLAERLVMLADDVFDAWRAQRAVFRRASVDGVQLSVRRGPGDGPVTLGVRARDAAESEQLSFPELDARTFVSAVTRFALSLAEAYTTHDPSQARNLRLKALVSAATTLAESIADSVADDSLQNPEPESYRSFGLPRARAERGMWDSGGKMRFLPRWVATVPNIDLRATFQCGERLIVGSQRETASIERASGQVLWRVPTPRAASVVTPLGLARLHPDGTIVLHDLDNGEARFTTHVAPRANGGATGALVNAAGLPKLLVVAEGDRSVTAIDLVSGDVRWRFTAKRPANYRVRRAGKLILVAGGDSALLALDVTSGEVIWRVRDRLPFSGDMSIDHDAVFALSGGPIGPTRLHHVDLWSGMVRWSKELDERPAPGHAPLLAAHIVAIPTRDRRGMGVSAYDRVTGDAVWEQAPGLSSPTTAFLAVDDTLIANSASGALLCLDATTGTLRYNQVFSRHVDADQPRRLEPVLRSGALFVPQHQVHVVRPRDGEIIGTIPSDLIPDLLRVDERCNVYIAEESGHVAAFGVAPRLTLVK